MSETTGPTDYALAPALRARLMGALLAGLGILVCAMTFVVFVAGLPLDVLSAVVLLVVLAVVVAGIVLNRRTYVVRVDEQGYRVRFVRGAGARVARWSDVVDLVSAEVADARCVVLRLRDGRSTTIPVDVLACDAEVFVRELRTQLDRARP